MTSRALRAWAPPSMRYPVAVKAALARQSVQVRPAPVARPALAIPGRWDATFADPEETFALHRWSWLLTLLAEQPSSQTQEEGVASMRDWLQSQAARRDGPAWTSYTTGERICNAILFCTLAERGKGVAVPPADVARELASMGDFLSERIEYNGPLATGNHVLNNARALYFSGRALGRADHTELALAILQHDVPIVIGTDGFLREGSSHYHFLVTRWLLEVIWLARLTGETRAPRLLEPAASAMVKRCWFFLVFDRRSGDWTMPLIGDVSPDCSSRWLLDLPWSTLATSVHRPGDMPARCASRGWGALMDVAAA